MSWQDRPYSGDPGPGHAYGPQGGLRSWFGGLPSPGKAVKWIAFVNIGLFVLCQLTGGRESPLVQWMAMQTELVLQGQIWRLFTFTYVHDQSGLMHIFFNMLGLYFLGMPLERHWGTKRFFAFYTLGGVAAVLLYLLVTVVGWLDAGGVLIGASGGVLAVLGACAVLFPGIRLILLIFPVPIRTAALIFCVMYAFNLLSRGSNAGGDACHIAGLAFGIAWGYRGHFVMHKWEAWRGQLRQGAWQARQEKEQELTQAVDQILDKVRREGINSLTRHEKRTLEEATRKGRDTDLR